MPIIRIFNWQEGRQNSGYFKLKLFEVRWPIGIDCYLLKFEDGVSVPEHTDPVTDKNHYRLNLTVRKAMEGGQFVCEKSILNFWRVCLFRPDINKHSLTIVRGKLIMLSLGVAL